MFSGISECAEEGARLCLPCLVVWFGLYRSGMCVVSALDAEHIDSYGPHEDSNSCYMFSGEANSWTPPYRKKTQSNFS